MTCFNSEITLTFINVWCYSEIIIALGEHLFSRGRVAIVLWGEIVIHPAKMLVRRIPISHKSTTLLKYFRVTHLVMTNEVSWVTLHVQFCMTSNCNIKNLFLKTCISASFIRCWHVYFGLRCSILDQHTIMSQWNQIHLCYIFIILYNMFIVDYDVIVIYFEHKQYCLM